MYDTVARFAVGVWGLWTQQGRPAGCGGKEPRDRPTSYLLIPPRTRRRRCRLGRLAKAYLISS